MFKAECVVLWGWKAEMSALLSKRICTRNKDVGVTKISCCLKLHMARSLALRDPIHEIGSLPNAFHGQLLTCKLAPILALLWACLSPYLSLQRDRKEAECQVPGCKGRSSPLVVSEGGMHLTLGGVVEIYSERFLLLARWLFLLTMCVSGN